MKKVLSKKERQELDITIEKVKDNNREIAHKIMELFFHYLGTPLTQEAGCNLPMYDWESVEDESIREIKKICSINVYILNGHGVESAHYTKGTKNEWTAHGFFIHFDHPLNLKRCFEKKFILKEDVQKLNLWIQKCLLGIVYFDTIEKWCKEEAEKNKIKE